MKTLKNENLKNEVCEKILQNTGVYGNFYYYLSDKEKADRINALGCFKVEKISHQYRISYKD
jgi:hypothetical protein